LKKELITILGPTATGKTSLATLLASNHEGEIISADSRQVFKNMDIGTGKDLEEYEINDRTIPHHLIDIKEAGTEYSLFDFQKDFVSAYNKIKDRKHLPILCGGTTLYLDSVLSRYELVDVPETYELDESYKSLSNNELIKLLEAKKKLHNSSDTEDRSRLLEAVRISIYKENHPEKILQLPDFNHHTFGILLPMNEIKQKISIRLKHRLKNGMIEEVENLINQGVSHEMLKYYGLEYKFISLFLQKEINYNDLYQKLNSAIHSFAKKQMTKYRSMEKNGVPIIWIDGNADNNEKLNIIRKHCRFLED
jgi:tRNA dimethylallyltransferase